MTKLMMVLATSTGGTARHVAEVARGCLRRGLEIHLVCGQGAGKAMRDAVGAIDSGLLAISEIRMGRRIEPLRDVAAAARLRRLIRGSGVGVIHLHSAKAGGLGRSALVGLGREAPAVVYSPHAYAFLSQPGLAARLVYWGLERALMPMTRKVVAVSPSEAASAARIGAEGRTVVIRNGVDPVPRPRRRANALGGRLRIGWLGRLAWQKDPLAAVRVSLQLRRMGVDHELLLGGVGPDEDEVRALVDRHKAGDRIRMPGFVSDTGEFHRSIDLFLTTSRCEGLPYAVLDAMAHGTPVAGFRVPGVDDLVEEGVTGWLADPGDDAGLAVHLSHFGVNAERRAAAGAAARRRVQREFRLEDQVDRLFTLYRTLEAERAARRRH